jgi:hypothetical protein
VLWDGDDNNGRSITGVGFQPDLVWIKKRNGTNDHNLFDSIRGSNIALFSSNTNGDTAYTDRLFSFDGNGFTVGSSVAINQSSRSFVAWCWKAGGEAVTNTDGSIPSVVSVNQDAGFSIVSFNCPADGVQEFVGHGLNKKPKFIIIKNRDTNANNWGVFHEDVIDTTSKFLRLNTTNSVVTYDTVWGSALPDSSVFGATGGGLSAAGVRMIAYCWAEIEGFSKFGSYVGNGNADGPFIYTGGRPAFVMIKGNNTSNWTIWDSSRQSTNPADFFLQANNTGVEANARIIDILSNGFKVRSAASNENASGVSYIYACWMESPFTTANAK